jgi:glycerophosphoryl diester phosphodiesterase
MLRVIAHRGASRAYPENSLVAFAHALECGADALEVDLRCSADGKIYCYHDRYLTRLTGHRQRIELTHSSVIDKLSLEGHEPVAGFEEFLNRFAGKTGFVLDIKPSGIERQILALTRTLAGPSQVIYSSFLPDVLREITRLDSGAHTALIVGPVRNVRPRFDLTDYISSQLADIRCNAIHISKRIATRKRIIKFKEEGYDVSVWTVDDSRHLEKFQKLDVYGVITNSPETMVPELRALRDRSRAQASGRRE